MVLLTLFFPVNSMWLSLGWVCQRFLIKPQGVNIIQFRSILVGFGSMYFFYFKAYMLELQKIFLIVRFFNQISCNNGLKTKISCFLCVFFCLTPPPETGMFQNQKDCFVPDITFLQFFIFLSFTCIKGIVRAIRKTLNEHKSFKLQMLITSSNTKFER